MIKELGVFTVYTPDKAPPNRPQHALYAKNGDGLDWYDIVGILDHGPTYAMIKDGRVVGYNTDPSSLWPVGCLVIVTDDLCNEDYIYSNGQLVYEPHVIPPGLPLSIAGSGDLSPEVKQLLVDMGTNLADAHNNNAALADRIASLEAVITSLKGAV